MKKRDEEETRQLPVKLTDGELLSRGESLAIAELTASRLGEVRARITADIKVQSEQRARYAAVIEAGSEARPVRCVWRADFELGTLELVRSDTGEVVEQAPLTAQDRQLPLTGIEALRPNAHDLAALGGGRP
jgi:hypothetical protein